MARKTSKSDPAAAEAKAAKRAALVESFESFVAELDEEEVAECATLFPQYSPNNALMIVMQRPSARDVHGYRDWQGRGRQVRKGETGIAIYAPRTRKDEDPKTHEEVTKVTGMGFTYVFDITQTDPMEG